MLRLGHRHYCFLVSSLLIVVAPLILPACARGQTATPTDNSEIWPGFTASFELSPGFRLQTFVERRRGEDSDYLLWRVGTAVSYQALRRIKRPDADYEEADRHYIVMAGGYQYIRTYENGGKIGEHRISAQVTPKGAIKPGILIQDRNVLEFRWRSDGYNFRYRNQLMVDRPFEMGRFVVIPYSSAEIFWDRNQHAWNQRRYAFGTRVPYRKLTFDTYYLLKSCTDCTRSPVNALGLSVTWYVNRKK
jgi:hypothetical protein